MAAVAGEDGRSETIQELSSDDNEDIEILEAEEIAAQRAAEAAIARVRALKARAGSSRSSAPAASRSSRRPSSYADVSERSLAPPDPLPVPPPAPPPIPIGPAALAILPIVGVDAAAGGILPRQVPAHLQNLYERARENVGNMEMTREFWHARDRDHQERRDQDPVHQAHPNHGAGVWTPEPVNAETDVQERARQLEARIKDLQDDRSARDPAADSPLPSFVSIQTLDAALTADAKPGVTEHVLLTPAATSPPPGPPIPDLLSADYYNNAQDNYPDFIPLKMTHEAVRDHGPPGDPSSSSSSPTSSSSSSRHKKKKKKVKKKKKKVTIPYKVESGDIKLPSWPTTTAFPAWRRTLRQAVISASDRPERARPWIFAIESDDILMDDLACADADRHRTLDAKLAEALAKILKGGPARKMALAAERAAPSHDTLNGRQ